MVTIRTGSFVKATATGNQDVTLPAGLPDMTAQAAGTWAVLFFSSGAHNVASEVWAANYQAMLGFATGAANFFAAGASSDDNVATSNAGRRMAAKCICFADPSGAVALAEADFVSFPTSGTMRVNWTTNNAGLYQVCYVVITGLTNAKVVNWAMPTVVGTKAVTGVGFVPDLVIHASDGSSTALPHVSVDTKFSLGLMNKQGQQWSTAFVSQDAVTANTSRWQQTDSCVLGLDPTETVSHEASFSSMDSDGFTLYFASVTTAKQVVSLCLKGIASKIGSFIANGGASQAVIDQHLGNPIRALFFAGTSLTPANAGVPRTHAYWFFGVEDEVGWTKSVSLSDDDASNPTKTKSAYSVSNVVAEANGGTGTYNGKGIVVGYDTTNFSLSWPSVSADEILYVTLMDPTVTPYPSKVGV